MFVRIGPGRRLKCLATGFFFIKNVAHICNIVVSICCFCPMWTALSKARLVLNPGPDLNKTYRVMSKSLSTSMISLLLSSYYMLTTRFS